jgi:hypothetical protein
MTAAQINLEIDAARDERGMRGPSWTALFTFNTRDSGIAGDGQ